MDFGRSQHIAKGQGKGATAVGSQAPLPGERKLSLRPVRNNRYKQMDGENEEAGKKLEGYMYLYGIQNAVKLTQVFRTADSKAESLKEAHGQA